MHGIANLKKMALGTKLKHVAVMILIIFKNIFLCNKYLVGCQDLYTFSKYWKHNVDALPANYTFILDKFTEYDVQSVRINMP